MQTKKRRTTQIGVNVPQDKSKVRVTVKVMVEHWAALGGRPPYVGTGPTYFASTKCSQIFYGGVNLKKINSVGEFTKS